MTTILVVDDHPEVRLMLRLALEPEGYEVLDAEDGSDALGIIEDAPPDLVLLDLMMPNIDGWEVLRRLDGRPAPPIVAISAKTSADGGHVAETLRLGALDYIAKPIDIDHLLLVVDALLRLPESARATYREEKLAAAGG